MVVWLLGGAALGAWVFGDTVQTVGNEVEQLINALIKLVVIGGGIYLVVLVLQIKKG